MRRLYTVIALVLTATGLIALPALANENPPSQTSPPAAIATAAPEPSAAPAEQATATKPAQTPAAPTKEPEKKVVAPAAGPLQIKIGDATVKFGLLVQPQADFTQNSSGKYVQNLMLRRTRFLVGGQVTKTVFFFFETENSRLGAANAAGGKTMSGFQTLDAAVEWRPRKAFNLSGGLIRVPTSREALESSSNEFTIDFNTYAFTASSALGSTGGNRDTGVMARGYLFDDRLEYRAAVVAGMRDSIHATHPFRMVGRVQYNFFDKEVYNFPSYAGSNFGNKKILAVGAAWDKQMNYQGYTTDLFADIPMSFGSALGTITFQQLDGGKTSPVTLAKSNIATIDGGLYFKKLKVGPWARYEQRDFDVANTRDEQRYLVGFNFYPMGNNFNIKAAVGRIKPETGRETNQFTVQLQTFYF